MMQKIFSPLHRCHSTRQCNLIFSQVRGNKSMARPPSIKRRRRRKSSSSIHSDKGDLPFGMNPVDYSTPPPVAPTLIPPPPKGGFQGMLVPFSMFAFIATGIYLYFNHDPETYDYWRKVETGGNIFDNRNDDEDYDDDEEDEE
mmetsp:Transcript_12522/g.18378  ORF Transcript_12522/g.18378 Transcript_12522/m.18378 type:complete len:143 (+) Transcript_12522:174-602(+)